MKFVVTSPRDTDQQYCTGKVFKSFAIAIEIMKASKKNTESNLLQLQVGSSGLKLEVRKSFICLDALMNCFLQNELSDTGRFLASLDLTIVSDEGIFYSFSLVIDTMKRKDNKKYSQNDINNTNKYIESVVKVNGIRCPKLK